MVSHHVVFMCAMRGAHTLSAWAIPSMIDYIYIVYDTSAIFVFYSDAWVRFGAIARDDRLPRRRARERRARTCERAREMTTTTPATTPFATTRTRTRRSAVTVAARGKGRRATMTTPRAGGATRARATVRASGGAGDDVVRVMVNGVSGKMGHATACAVVRREGFELVPYALTKRAGATTDVLGVEVTGVDVSVEDAGEVLERAKREYPGFVVVDYTLPESVNANAELYVKHGVPFVMGTTGGDREKMLAEVKASGNYAVIAPQMGKQVVAFQAAMKLMAEQFPNAFEGYTLTVTESHQSSKKDTSGTAKAIVASFNDLGCGFDIKDIELVRDVESQTGKMGVPEEHLLGHAFHTYRLTSPDGTVSFEFQHNVCGRNIYAEGTVDAVGFLKRKIASKDPKTLYDMIDVLGEGAMK